METLYTQRAIIYNQMKEAKTKNDLQEYYNKDLEYKRITAKIYHEKNKEKQEYKTRKKNNLKKYLEIPENYEKHKKTVLKRLSNITTAKT